MTVFSAKPQPGAESDNNVRIAIYAGTDSDHLQFSGIVVLRGHEVREFCDLINRPKPRRELSADEDEPIPSEWVGQ
jgi:hypothetical protein